MMNIPARISATVKVRDLPDHVRDRLGLPLDADVRMTIEADPLAARARLKRVMDRMGAEATARGLTRGRLEEILSEG